MYQAGLCHIVQKRRGEKTPHKTTKPSLFFYSCWTSKACIINSVLCPVRAAFFAWSHYLSQQTSESERSFWGLLFLCRGIVTCSQSAQEEVTGSTGVCAGLARSLTWGCDPLPVSAGAFVVLLWPRKRRKLPARKVLGACLIL